MMKTSKKIVYLFVFDGYADYETSLAGVGVRKSGGFRIVTIAMSKNPVVSMSGLTVVPDRDFIADVDLVDIDTSNTAMLIMPGGRSWEAKGNEGITPLVAHCLLLGIPIAAICGATVLLADLGLLNRTVHTSNHVEYLAAQSQSYHGRALYQNAPSVRTEFLITASGTAATEFAHDIFDTLGITEEARVQNRFQYFQQQAVA